MDETITITKKEYEELKEAADILRKLRIYGVDNWEGYCDAINDSEGWAE